MQSVQLRAVLSADRRLSRAVPDVMPEGAVLVTIEAIPEEKEARCSVTLGELLAEIDRMPHRRYTKEEIDRFLAEERASWG
jgi:hypothetical protein